MVTLDHIKCGNTVQLFISGLSGDQKPTEKIEGTHITQGSVFREIDTSSTYLFDKENKRWIRQTSAESSGGSILPDHYELANEEDIRGLWKSS